MEDTYQKKDTEEIYKKQFKEGDTGVLKYYLGKVRNRFIEKYNARKQKDHMRAGLLKPKSLSIDTMSSRLKILNNYLSDIPSPDNKSFSQGEIIEIILSMLPAVWLSSMTASDLDLRENSYEDVIEHLEIL